MPTKFEEIYGRALFKFTDYSFINTCTDLKEAVLQKYLLSSIVDFQHSCKVTVFQLYDQFFQYGYLRAMDLSEMAYSNHGGKDFDIQAWLKPITNLEKEQK